MASKIRSLFLLAVLAVVNGRKGLFTTMTNLEKLYYMESEVISLADIFLREEYLAHDGEDAHDFGAIKTMVAMSKEIHLNVSNITDYLSHPINVLHLTRRLHSEWPEALTAIRNSEPCTKWEMPTLKLRMNSIRKNFPRDTDLEAVALSIAQIQYTEDINLEDLFVGLISGKRPLQPVTLTDLMDMARAAYDGGHYLFTTKLAEKIISDCKKSKRQEGCEDVKLYKIASSSYYQINNLKEAIAMTEQVLKLDPDNKHAKRNRKFYEGRLQKGKNKGSTTVFDVRNIKYYQTCRGERSRSPATMSRLYCALEPTNAWLSFERVEYHNINPPVIEIHSTFSAKYLKTMLKVGERGYQRQALGEKYETPDHTHKPNPTYIYQVFSKRFVNMKGPLIWPLDIGTVEVRQIGMQGMYFRPKNRATIPTLGGHIGSFFTPLNSNFSGGEFVFPKYKLKFKPGLGNTIFFFATKSTLNICPVSFGVQWLAVQSLFEIKQKATSRLHDEDLYDTK